MFYIKKISLITEGNTVSDVVFEPGLNIIYGESNTGKSLILDSIDYMFGAKEHRFDLKLKVKKVIMVLIVDGKKLTMNREIDSSDIVVVSEVDGIESDTYKIGNAKKSLNAVWLYLLGITDEVKILQTITGKPQRLTLRTFSHTLLLDEGTLQGMPSILSSGKGKNPKVDTSVLTALLYLATANNYMPEKAGDPKVKKAKSDAVKTFVDRSMIALENKKISELNNFSKESPGELQKKIDSVLDEIGAAEGALESALSQSEGYAERIAGIDAEMTNCRMLKNRNASLLSQYESDIKRLTFIVEGDIHSEKVPALDRCPFCNGELPKDKGESCIDAAIAEVEKVESQIKDLKSVQTSIDKEIEELKGEREKIYAERKRVDATIRGELRPQIADLKNVLADYTLALGQYKAKEMIEAFSDVLVKELEVSVAENSTEFHFNLKEKLIEVFQEKLDEDLKVILEACNYHNFTGVRFDMDTYDVIVNGHLKKSQGKGYRAFLNTVVAISFQNCLDAYSNIRK